VRTSLWSTASSRPKHPSTVQRRRYSQVQVGDGARVGRRRRECREEPHDRVAVLRRRVELHLHAPQPQRGAQRDELHQVHDRREQQLTRVLALAMLLEERVDHSALSACWMPSRAITATGASATNRARTASHICRSC
jgi:hypothetical protein